MSYSVQVMEAVAVPTAVIRERVPASELARFVPAACGEVWNFIKAAGLPSPGRHVALYLEEGVVEMGAEVGGPFAGDGRVESSELPAGRVATATYFGAYGGLGKAHAAIREWCAAEGHTLSGVCWELYGHWQESWNAEPSKIRTDVFYLLR